jgi:hypothetical protein
MPTRVELHLRLPNSPGAFASVCRVLADERVTIEAFSLERTGSLRLVVDNHVRAAGALRAAHHKVTTQAVLVATLSAGSDGLVAPTALLAAEGLNIEYAYCGRGATGPIAVLGMAEPERAAAAAGV